MKSVEQREELHKTIWKIANDLRGSVDGWDFKSYVLGFLFYYFISEKLKSSINELHNADYENLSDEEAENGKETILDTYGFFIKPSALFSNVLKNADLEKLNETLSGYFKEIQTSSKNYESSRQFDGLFADVDLYSNKLGNSQSERNKRILSICERLRT